MIVGTHRDMEGKDATKKREEKEGKLLKLFIPAFQKEVIYYNRQARKFIFPLNAKNPSSEDRAVVEKIQRLVTNECSPTPADVPLQYFALEIVLEEASEKLGRGILSIEECVEAAAKLHFNRHTLDAALQFLDGLSVLFYFPEVLEGVVFVDPQVLLDKATELVKKLYELLEGTGCDDKDDNAGVWQIFIDHACFDLDFLSRPDFSQHYLPGLFTPVELVKLFKRLLIFADFPIPKNKALSHTKHFFMPALLQVLNEDEISKHCVPSDSLAAALALDFPLGGPRLGSYCALCCFLVSSNNRFPCPWEVDTDTKYNTPTCLYRNCIRFVIPDYPCSVTLIDTFSHFQVHMDVESEWCQEMCSFVRQAIVSGLKTVTSTLGYVNSTPTLAFVCPCNVGTDHVAKLQGSSWVCRNNWKKNGKASARYLIWELDKGMC